MKRIFYAATPYHILLSSTLNRQLNHGADSCLLVASNSRSLNPVIDILGSWGNFTEIIKFESIHGKPLPQKWGRRSIHSIRSVRLLRTLSPSEIYVCHDTGPIGQALLKLAADDCLCTYIEDGAAAYNSSEAAVKPVWKKIAGKIFYGPWWSPNRVIGTDPNIDRIAATFPKNIRQEHSPLPTLKIKSERLCESRDYFASSVTEAFDIDLERKEITAIVLPTHSQAASEGRQRSLQSAISDLEQNETVALKYHPRDPNAGYLDTPETITLPPEIPAELIYLCLDNLSTVVGNASTALLTAKWLSDTIDVISSAKSSGDNDPAFLEAMEGIGIEIC